MSLLNIPFVFSAGAVIIASQHNSNFSVIYGDYNGFIDNNNISASAAIAYSKITLTNSIVNADINSAAAIVDTKLAQITTASKVSGTALTSLASIPSGAGIVPIANLGTSPTSATFLRGDGAFAAAGYFILSSNTAMSGVTNSGDITIDKTKTYKVIVNLSAMSVADILDIRFNNDTGSGYRYVYRGFDVAASASNGNNSGGTSAISMCASVNGTSDTVVGIEFTIFPQFPSGGKHVNVRGTVTGIINTTSARGYWDFAGFWTNSADVTSFRIKTNGGTATMTGNVLLYELLTA